MTRKPSDDGPRGFLAETCRWLREHPVQARSIALLCLLLAAVAATPWIRWAPWRQGGLIGLALVAAVLVWPWSRGAEAGRPDA